jgi:hypothetical protein
LDDLDTLEKASEEDLRKEGLKMGDIISVRSVLQRSTNQLNYSNDSGIADMVTFADKENLDADNSVIEVRYFPPKISEFSFKSLNSVTPNSLIDGTQRL